MDDRAFDRFAARLAATSSRRGLLAALLAAALGVAPAAAARCSKARPCPVCRRCKKRRCKPDAAQDGSSCGPCKACDGGACATDPAEEGTPCGVCTVCFGGNCVADPTRNGETCGPGKACADGACACDPTACDGCCVGDACVPEGECCGLGLRCADGTCGTAVPSLVECGGRCDCFTCRYQAPASARVCGADVRCQACSVVCAAAGCPEYGMTDGGYFCKDGFGPEYCQTTGCGVGETCFANEFHEDRSECGRVCIGV